ncbi:MAG: carbonic anhydrase [Candidatus Binataceae bacterium]
MNSFYRRLFMTLVLFGAALAAGGASAPTQEPAPASPQAALQRLLEGNRRFASGLTIHPNYPAERRLELVEGQKPFAVIVGCSDSRTAPTIVFDRGLGDLFVVSLAGNVVDPIAIESVGYAVNTLETPLVCVLGHEKCGAVSAAVKYGTGAPGLEHLMATLQPAVDSARREPGDLVHNAILENVKRVMGELRNAVQLKPRLEAGKVRVCGGVYNLESGHVELIGPDCSR